jgi:chromate transporter
MNRHAEIFLTALRLGCLSFGGPIAHLSYFHNEYVQRRKWLDDAQYSDIVALCQFLPGPASSQVGFAIGTLRGGVLGGVLAWLGFTLPSALLMLGFALGILLAALYQPVWTAAIQDARDVVILLLASALLIVWKRPAWLVVLVAALAGQLLLTVT